MLMLVVFLVSLACTNLDQVAHAGVITHATSAVAYEPSTAFELTPEPAQFHQSLEVPPTRDGKALACERGMAISDVILLRSGKAE